MNINALQAWLLSQMRTAAIADEDFIGETRRELTFDKGIRCQWHDINRRRSPDTAGV
jgi:hypothetical protein